MLGTRIGSRTQHAFVLEFMPKTRKDQLKNNMNKQQVQQLALNLTATWLYSSWIRWDKMFASLFTAPVSWTWCDDEVHIKLSIF